MKKVIEFCQALPHPSMWAAENGLPAWLISRIRKSLQKAVTTKHAEKIIRGADGALTLEDFRPDD